MHIFIVSDFCVGGKARRDIALKIIQCHWLAQAFDLRIKG